MTWLTHAWPQVLSLAGTHLWLSVLAILTSLVVATPLGYVAARRPHVRPIVSGVATVVYAVPALPLLIIIPAIIAVPLRSTATIVIALTCYGVALMVRTATDAFLQVDESVRDAAVAVGHAPASLWWRVDLPLAMPILTAGARVLTVTTVGLVTIGALIGVPSLGTLFTDGFQRGIVAEVATGILATVAIGLVLDQMVAHVGAMRPRRRPPRPTRPLTWEATA